MKGLSEKVAVVTGASKGIGAGIASALAAAGARVAVNYSSDRDGAERVARAITDSGGEAIVVGADVSNAADVACLFNQVRKAGCSGQQRRSISLRCLHGDYRRELSPPLQHQRSWDYSHSAGGGQTVRAGGRQHHQPQLDRRLASGAGSPTVRVDEGAIETLTRGLALELAPRKIRVNAIAPGHTETEGNVAAGTFDGGAGAALAKKTPLGRLGRVSDITPLAVFLASDESGWITGEIIRAAGGLVVAT
jgi:3-oxoacyl-[acyl-carrier protein] reductase